MMVALPSGVSRGGNEEGLSGGASSKSRSRSPMLDMAGFCSRLVEFFSPGQPALTHLLLPPPPLPPVELQTSGWAGLIQLLGVAWAEGSGKGSCRGLTEGLGRGQVVRRGLAVEPAGLRLGRRNPTLSFSSDSPGPQATL